jgi:hypothetical protein
VPIFFSQLFQENQRVMRNASSHPFNEISPFAIR